MTPIGRRSPTSSRRATGSVPRRSWRDPSTRRRTVPSHTLIRPLVGRNSDLEWWALSAFTTRGIRGSRVRHRGASLRWVGTIPGGIWADVSDRSAAVRGRGGRNRRGSVVISPTGDTSKLLLTSGGVTNASIREGLVQLLGKPIGESTALCIPTAQYGHPMVGPGLKAWQFIRGNSENPM